MGGVQNSASPQRPVLNLASGNKTEHFLLYLEDFLDFIVFCCCFFFFWGGGGDKATHLLVVAYSVLQYLLSLVENF